MDNMDSFSPRFSALMNHRWSFWGWLLLVLIVTLLMRIPYIYGAGHNADLVLLGLWGDGIVQQGLFSVYANVPTANYPPVIMFMLALVAPFWQNTDLSVPLLKVFPILCETLLILAVAVWLRNEKGWRWLIPFFLAINPGVIATTALWGQVESVMTLFLVLTLLALNRDKPVWVGIFYALAMLSKFQSVVIVPLLVILMFRRYGIVKSLIAALAFGVVMVIFLLPFIMGSGWDAALRHYNSAFDAQPTTLNAFNLWYWITPTHMGDMWSGPAYYVMDDWLFQNTLSYRNLGLGMLSVYTLLICISMWRNYQQKREFLWATALYVGFFMLTTRMHERYVFPAIIFSVIAVAQDRRAWFTALSLAVTYLFNVVYTLDVHLVWFGLPLLRLLPGTLLNSMIALSVVTLVELARLLFADTRLRLVNLSVRVVGVIVFAVFVVQALTLPLAPLPPAATPVDAHFDNGLTLEGFWQAPEESTLYWRVSDEIPQGLYGIRFLTQQSGEFQLLSEEPLQINNMSLHLSWVGRQMESRHALSISVAPLYVSLYRTNGSWSSEPILIKQEG
jgi:Gpi18-like mannosyltransferase